MDGLSLAASGELLYTDVVGKDACGIGGVAAKDGKPSTEVLQKTLMALGLLEHRGGVCGDAGDGAGISSQIPQGFFREKALEQNLPGARDLTASDILAVGVLFICESEKTKIDAAKALIYEVLSSGPHTFLGFRAVPTNDEILPEAARSTKPGAIEQVLLKIHGEQTAAETWCYRKRLMLREKFRQANLDVYAVSFSTRLIGYKGLLTSGQLSDYFPDLHDPMFETGIAYFHRRYSTNTFPNWKLAQPFRMTCHNGEINTIRTNRNAVAAYSRGLNPPVPGGDLLSPMMSDSGNLDEWFDYLVNDKNWSILRAMRLSLPPVWDTEADVWGPEAFQLFTYCRRTFGSLSAWDGPAGLVSSDGRYLVGLVDRMGLRPVRWCFDKRGWLYIGSESGVFGLEATNIVASGQLQPGEMIALDTHTGERLGSHQVMGRVVAEAKDELGDIHELNKRQIVLTEGFDYTKQTENIVESMEAAKSWTLECLLQAAGWDLQRSTFVKDMAKLSKEPLSSMGHDRVLTIFSQYHPTLFKYCQQTFAEVTNPPIDPYREGGAMSLTTYLGRSPLRADVMGSGDKLPVKQVELSSPVVSDAVIDEIRNNELIGMQNVDATFLIEGGVESFRAALEALKSSAEKAIHEGYNVLMVTDRQAEKRGVAPIPSLLALGAVHNHLCKQGLRDRCSLVVQAGDIQEGHDIAVLVAFGADAVHPYLMLQLVKNGLTWKHAETKQEVSIEPRDALQNLFYAIEDSLLKIISKMGITTVEGYRGAMLFEAVGFGPELMHYFGDFPSRIGGLTLADLVDDVKWRIEKAEAMAKNNTPIGSNRDYHAFNGKIRSALRDAVKEAHTEPEGDGMGGEMAYLAPPRDPDPNRLQNVEVKYGTFTNMIKTRPPTVLRDMFIIKETGRERTLIDEVQPAMDIVRNHFRGAAMSHGALTGESHMTIAAACNELGGLSNSGEGGEARWRNDIPQKAWGEFWSKIMKQRQATPEIYCIDPNGDIRKSRFRSRIRQVASGRFGVDAEYLINADELQIKMAQGAKPGEGGQLMGKKVSAEIAEIRFAKQGTDLISPPPHHDIYSIEDLAQLIHDLKAVNPGKPVSVKLVAVENIGTIAVGVAKAGADIIEIDGIDGGTGAAMVSSKEHAGLPSEMGLAEAHQALVVNGIRSRVKLRVGGGIKNGYDVVKYSLFGADQFSFGQGLMVSVGCIVCKSCHIPNCPTGITGSPDIFKGHPEHTKAYLMSVAEEVQQILTEMGYKHISELTGKSDYLEKRTDAAIKGRIAAVDVRKFIRPDMAMEGLHDRFAQIQGKTGICDVPGMTMNEKMLSAVADSIEMGKEATMNFRVKNSDRSIGATIAGQIAKFYGREGMPNGKKISFRFEGEAGQSFGVFCIDGLDLELQGFAQDGVAKGISGGTVVVTLDYGSSDFGNEIQSVAGNNVGYGATGGNILIGGRAGHRLGIRNSGATIVAEAAGKYACEYMTRGRVLILGPIENEIGSGMTGGELFVFDPKNEVYAKLHSKSVAVIETAYSDYEWIHPLILRYFTRTKSRQADHILKNWVDIRRERRLKKILPLAVARALQDFKTVGTNAG
ncbi:MAG: glutamate synthase-related protein [Fimbriiglobus sp.]